MDLTTEAPTTDDGLADTAKRQSEQPPLPVMDNPNALLTVNEFCAWARVTTRTWRSWCASGDAPRRIKIGSGIRVRVADALAWADARVVRD